MSSTEFSRFKRYRAKSKMTAKKIKLLKLHKARFNRRNAKQCLKSELDFDLIDTKHRIKDDCRNLL